MEIGDRVIYYKGVGRAFEGTVARIGYVDVGLWVGTPTRPFRIDIDSEFIFPFPPELKSDEMETYVKTLYKLRDNEKRRYHNR